MTCVTSIWISLSRGQYKRRCILNLEKRYIRLCNFASLGALTIMLEDKDLLKFDFYYCIKTIIVFTLLINIVT